MEDDTVEDDLVLEVYTCLTAKQYCHKRKLVRVNIGPTTFRYKNWSDPGPLLVFQKWSGYFNVKKQFSRLAVYMQCISR